MIEQTRAEAEQRRQAGRSTPNSSNVAQQDEGYWAYMQRQVQERTEKLGFAGDTMDNLEQSSQSWLNDVNKFVNQQKRNAATSCKCNDDLDMCVRKLTIDAVFKSKLGL